MRRILHCWRIPWVLCSLIALLSSTPCAAADKTAADYFIRSLPGQPEGPLIKMHAGHIEVSPEHNGNLFFWHFQNRHVANRRRTVIWLNGGPGCSSMDGALMEIGPYRLKNEEELVYQEGSWDEFANLLFVDQPIGTGFSYVDSDSYLHELRNSTEQLVSFLEKWFALFPDYESDDIYIAGESFAGQYIPYIGKAILDRNAKLGAGNKVAWRLQGLLIGNGWIDPIEQYLAYLPFAYDKGVISGGSDAAKKVETLQTKCRAELSEADPDGTGTIRVPTCEDILTKMLDLTREDGQCVNQYDVRLRDPTCGMAWPPDLSRMNPYLRRQDVMKALHINRDKRTGWTECAGAVGLAFGTPKSKPSVTLLPDLLEAGIPVLLFSGDQDLICNHVGTEESIHKMVWSGGTGFELSPGVWAPKRDWVFEDEPAGVYQEARNLTYVLFYNSSHMVPFDYPRRTRDMLDRFMGVDIASIGGSPADSRIDGEKAGVETSVGGHPNSTAAAANEEKKLQDVERKAYYKSGEAALLVVVLAAAAIWGWCFWVQRRRKRGYASVPPQENGGLGSDPDLEASRRKQRGLDAADFDENELDDLTDTPRPGDRAALEDDAHRYSLGTDSESDGDGDQKANGSGSTFQDAASRTQAKGKERAEMGVKDNEAG